MENINHFHAVRIRVVGSGNLDMRLLSLDEVYTQQLTPLVMAASTNIQPTVLANFMQQRACLEVKINELDEYFQIGRILVYTKQVFTSYPQ